MKNFGLIVEQWEWNVVLLTQKISIESGRSPEECIVSAIEEASQIARMTMGLVVLIENTSPANLALLSGKSVAEYVTAR